MNFSCIKKTSSFEIISIILSSLLYLSNAAHAKSKYVDAGNVAVSWKFDKFIGNHPENGPLTDLTFRFTVNKETLRAKGTYFAQQFYFESSRNKDSVAYTGLQPQPDKDGKQYLRAVFSSFIPKSKSTDKNCSDGADGGPGVSCGIIFPAKYGHTYKILIQKTSAHRWDGEVEDERSGKKIHIGSWTLPPHIGNIKPYGAGFSEYYNHYEPGYPQFVVPSCDKLAKISVNYGPVSTTNYGGGIGSIYDAYEYQNKHCKLKLSNFIKKFVPAELYITKTDKLKANSVEIKRGWVSNN